MAIEEVNVIKLDTEPAKRSLKDLQKELRATKDEMAGLEAGSEAFRIAANKAGELQHSIQEINESVRGASSDFGDMLGNIGKVGAGITGAFQTATAALSIFGIESEEVAKSIKTMQNLMAMTQGLASIDQAIKSFKKLSTTIQMSSKSMGAFKTALVATGLGALVVVLGSIIANWDEFTESIGLSEKQMNKFGEVVGGVMNVLKGSLKAVTQSITRIVTGDFKGAWQSLKDGFDIATLYADGVQQTITKREQEASKAAAEANKKAVEAAQKAADEKRKIVEESLNIELEIIKRSDKAEKERIQAQIDVEKRRLELMKKGSLEYEQQLTKIYELEKELNAPEKVKEEKKKEEKEDPAITKLKNELKALQDSYRTKQQIIDDNEAEELDILQRSYDNQLISYEEFEKRKLEVAEKYNLERKEASKQYVIDLTAEQQELIQNTANVSGMALNMMSDILSSFADMQDTTTKEGFEKQKKLSIAAATIQMIQGIATALSGVFTTKSGPWDIAIAAMQAASIAASGAFQIAKIKKQTFEGASSGAAGSVANISSSASQMMNIPLQYTRDIDQAGQSIESAIKDTRVYVVESDIASTHSRVGVQESENRY